MALSRALTLVGALILLAGGGALALWGTRWTLPQDAISRDVYFLRDVWKGARIPNGPLQRPIGMAVAPSGDVYVTDGRLRVVRFSRSGEFLGQWGREGDGRGEFRNPVGVGIGPDGAVYVSDYEQDRVQKFSATGDFVSEFGRSGDAPGEFSAPADVHLDEAGFIYVADFYNHRIQKLQPSGLPAAVIGHPGRVGNGRLHYPTGIAITTRQELLVADAYNYQLQWFDRDGAPIRRAGYHVFWLWPRRASSSAGFAVPTGVAVGRDGLIHVADSGNHRVVMLSTSGAYIGEWRIVNASPDIYSPEQLAVSPDGSTVYATDLAGNQVLVLSVTPPKLH